MNNYDIFGILQKFFNVVLTFSTQLYNALFHEFTVIGKTFYLWEGLTVVSGAVLISIWLIKSLT